MLNNETKNNVENTISQQEESNIEDTVSQPDNKQPQYPVLELSTRAIKKNKKDKDKVDKNRYQIMCRIEDDCKVILRQWARGSKDIGYFTEAVTDTGKRKVNDFSGDRFGIRKGGTYTVFIKDSQGKAAIEHITIKRNRVYVIVFPLFLLFAVPSIYGFLAKPLHLPLPSPVQKIIDNGHGISGIPGSQTPQQILAALKKQQLMVTDNVGPSINFQSGKSGTSGTWVLEDVAKNKLIMQAHLVLQGKLAYKTEQVKQGNKTVTKQVKQVESAGALDGKEIAMTVPVYPGEYTNSLKLQQDIPPGTYSVVATVDYYKVDTKAFYSKAYFTLPMTVAN